MYNALAYLVYLALALLVVLVVGRLLYKNGRFFLLEIFGEERTADAVNRFLYAGYCLVNAGGAFNCLHSTKNLTSLQQSLEYVSFNQGILLLLLGAMHCFNLAVLPSLKSLLKSKHSTTPPH